MLVGVINNSQICVAECDTDLYTSCITVQCRQGSSPGHLFSEQELRHSKLLPFSGAIILNLAGSCHRNSSGRGRENMEEVEEDTRDLMAIVQNPVT